MMRGWDIFFIPGKSWWWMIEGWPEISRGIFRLVVDTLW
jgi:hypothetical protein